MDRIHSWHSVEVHQLTEMVNLNVIDGTIIEASLLKELRKEKKLRSCCQIGMPLGIISLKKQTLRRKLHATHPPAHAVM